MAAPLLRACHAASAPVTAYPCRVSAEAGRGAARDGGVRCAGLHRHTYIPCRLFSVHPLRRPSRPRDRPSMPLTTCPDCAREVSTEAPSCIHCGRPQATSSSPANLAEKPAAGIATALVLGVLSIVWVAQRGPSHSREMQDANALINALTVLGNAALLILALLSLWGHRGA